MRSMFSKLNEVVLPEFSNTRIMMMPVILGNLAGIPEHYKELVSKFYKQVDKLEREGKLVSKAIGCIGYLTIDERIVKAGESLRRKGKHVDGVYQGKIGAWGGGGGWGSVGNGMLTVSSTEHCKVYSGFFQGFPGDDGECDHINTDNMIHTLLKANTVYRLDGLCIHESLPVVEDTQRQFIRLSLPSNGPWFEGYTKNPYGILPSDEILPERTQYMN